MESADRTSAIADAIREHRAALFQLSEAAAALAQSFGDLDCLADVERLDQMLWLYQQTREQFHAAFEGRAVSGT